MISSMIRRAGLGLAFAFFLQATPSMALDTTWVSINGDDNNNCNPGTPCRFLPRAYDQTDPRGRIIVLNTGTFLGTGLVITKSISVIAKGVQAQLAGAGGNKIVINAGPNGTVLLDGLNVKGVRSAFDNNGILFNSGRRLHIRNCLISGFRSAGINIDAQAPSEVIISDCAITDNRRGILVRKAGGSGQVRVLLDNVTVSGNDLVGVRSAGAATHVRINRSTIANNGTGLVSASNGRLISLGNNVIRANGTNGAPTHTENLQ
jgi:hypothetical protein